MTRLIAATSALICVAAAAWAASGSLDAQVPTVIRIEVSTAELTDCRETLSDAAQMPAVHDNGSPILFGTSDDLPTVACVVR